MNAKPRILTLRQLILAFIPVVLWLLLFSHGVRLIPDELKPEINVSLLPAIDNLFFLNSHNWFASNGSYPNLDLLAAVPYTIHSVLPLAYLVASMQSPERRANLPRFVFAFGSMNLAAVCTHLAFPTAPPWYYIKYGSQPANYSMKGDPAVLDRVDKRFNMQMFHKMYAEVGKLVFGAWPSLHAAWPYLMTRFQPTFGRKAQVVMMCYVLLVWWAALYLQHHYAFDILGGVIYAELAMWLVSVEKRKDDGLPYTRADLRVELNNDTDK